MQEKESEKHIISVPSIFFTSRGSMYEYFADGSGFVARTKFDGTTHVTRGITIFLTEEQMGEVSKMYANQHFMSPKRQRRWYVMEDLGDRGSYIWEAGRVKNPSKLVLVTLDGTNVVVAKEPVSLVPSVGSYPFQQSIREGKVNHHLGDEVVLIDTSTNLNIVLDV